MPYSLTRQSKASRNRTFSMRNQYKRQERGRDRPSTVYNRRGENMPRDTEEQEGVWNQRGPVEIIKKIGIEKPNWLTEFLNQCLCRQIFPTIWKVAKLVLIPKGTTEPDSEETKYRPICLQNSISKLYEALIKGRLEAHIEDIQGISENSAFARECQPFKPSKRLYPWP
ncbi:hypothetical protein JTB14_013727 [Gonioctena quinquepunctata]|nr:hypothetical protein JTB14_013727 [Gonioctena quinquepunctata]